MAFVFTPATGLNDTSVYPTTPANEAAARQQVMDPLNQIRDYINLPLTAPWIAPTLLNSWINFGAPFANAGYYKDNFSIVRFKGLIKGGTTASGTQIISLPAGYRPLSKLDLQLLTTTGGTIVMSTLEIGTDGVLNFGFAVGTTWVSLDGLSFRAEQ